MSHLIELNPENNLQSSFNSYTTNESSAPNLFAKLKNFVGDNNILQIRNQQTTCRVIFQVSILQRFPKLICSMIYNNTNNIYKFQFMLHQDGDIIIGRTSKLRDYLLKQMQKILIKQNLNEYTFTINRNSGEFLLKRIHSLPIKIEFSSILIFQLKMKLNRIMKLFLQILKLTNQISPSALIYFHRQINNIQQQQIEKKIIQRSYKYLYLSIIQFSRSYSKGSTALIENPPDIDLRNELEKNSFEEFGDQTLSLFHLPINNKAIRHNILEINSIGLLHLETHLSLPHQKKKKKEINFVFNQIIVKNLNFQYFSTSLKGAVTKIVIAPKLAISSLLADDKNQIQQNVQIKTIAIKIPSGQENEQFAKSKIMHEIDILKLFSMAESPFLLKYYVSKQSNFKFNGGLMMNLLNRAENLYNFLSKRQKNLSFLMKTYILINIVQSVRFIKNYNVVHMDLGPNNILINHHYFPFLIDFGQSYGPTIKNKNYNPGFTLPFTPPQRFNTQKYSHKSDMYSMGIILYYMIFQSYPFHPSFQLVKGLKNNRYLDKFYFAPESLNYIGYIKIMNLLFSTISKCMDPDPEMRPHAQWVIILLKQIFYWSTEVFNN